MSKLQMVRHCATCALRNKNNICMKFKLQVVPDDDFCGWHTDELFNCEICGSRVLRPTILEDTSGVFHTVCADCAGALNTCVGCANAAHCLFEEDTSCGLPKVVQQRIEQNGMLYVGQVRNPDRIRELCRKCDCFDGKNGCLRQNNYCAKHSPLIKEKIYEQFTISQSD